MATEKKFVGNVTVRETQYGEIIKMGFTAEHLELLKQHLQGGWVNVDILSSQNGGKYAVINEFKADPAKGKGATKPQATQKTTAPVQQPIANAGMDDDELPF